MNNGWGEKCCIHASDENRPCVPKRLSCNVMKCKLFKWDRETPSYLKMWGESVPDFQRVFTRNQRKRRRKKK